MYYINVTLEHKKGASLEEVVALCLESRTRNPKVASRGGFSELGAPGLKKKKNEINYKMINLTIEV